MQQGHPGAWVGYAVTAIIICVVLFFRFRSMRRVQKLRLERLWVVPAVYAVVTGIVLYQSMPCGVQWLYVAIALGLGALLGWRRGALMRCKRVPGGQKGSRLTGDGANFLGYIRGALGV